MPRQSPSKRSSLDTLGGAFLAAVLVLIVAGCSPSPNDWRRHVLPDRIALQSELDAPDKAMLREVYATRGFQPMWMEGRNRRNGARQLIGLLETSDDEGLNPARYDAPALAKRLDKAWRSSPRERARTDLLLTAAYIEYVRDLHTPTSGDDVAYTDPDLQPLPRDRAIIARQLASNLWPQSAIKDATRMNVLYVQTRNALAQRRAMALTNDNVEPILLRNLDRLRALPSALGDRFVLVDIVANRLWMYENNRPVDSMKVIVGAPNEQTPQMAALIRYAIYNPFWNVPPDMTRDTYAPRIAANVSALSALRMDAWSGFTPDAKVLSPRAVNWNSVARGEDIGWLRQRPGPGNSMGAVKFMLPNAMGIYLHDTPQRELFNKEQRFFSAGCIRVEDYRRLSRWLFGGVEVSAQGAAAEQRFDLPNPVPVYIVYLTARADGDAVQLQPDVYGRDRQQASAASAPAPRPAAAPSLPAVAVERSPGAAPAGPRALPAPPVAPIPIKAPAAPAPPAQVARPAAPVAPPQPAVVQRPAPSPKQPAVVQRPAPAPQQPAVALRPAIAPQQPTVTQRAALAPSPAPPRAAGACRIQAGVFSQRANADNLVRTMQPMGEVRVTEIGSDGRTLYSVALVGLSNRGAAESALAKLNSTGKLSARIAGCSPAN